MLQHWRIDKEQLLGQPSLMADLRNLVLPLQQEPPSQQDEAMRDAFRQAAHPRQQS
ncbi:hypothetical protein [Ktedonobacter racemifer]|uniref:hypothetical protein n=1 Tax=Ktedonobacter racemifer TaxID=363277 RepID=UPI00031BEE90|nr:hypothetical protein [Ktedonobacter racemifer]